MQKIVAQTSNYKDTLSTTISHSKNNRKTKYGLIYDLNLLKTPVFHLVQNIIKKPRRTLDKQNRKMSANQKKSFNRTINQQFKSVNEAHQGKNMSLCMDATGRKEYVSRVGRIFNRKRQSLSQQQNIDRLNARLEVYINQNIGSQKVRELKSQP